MEQQKQITKWLRREFASLIHELLEAEVDSFLSHFSQRMSKGSLRRFVRNGYSRERALQSSLGSLSIRPPRVKDRECRFKFVSRVLTPYSRRLPGDWQELLWLYVDALATADITRLLDRLVLSTGSALPREFVQRAVRLWRERVRKLNSADLAPFQNRKLVFAKIESAAYSSLLRIEICLAALSDELHLLAVHIAESETPCPSPELLDALASRGLIADVATGESTLVIRAQGRSARSDEDPSDQIDSGGPLRLYPAESEILRFFLQPRVYQSILPAMLFDAS